MKPTKKEIEDRMLTDLNDFMKDFGIEEITFGKTHKIKRTKDEKAENIITKTKDMMNNRHRVNIVREAKKDPRWSSNEGVQDELIEEGCKKRGFELVHFYNADGKVLNKLLGI